MLRPQLAWLPERFRRDARFPTLEGWLNQAWLHGIGWLEIPLALLPSHAPEVLRAIIRRLEKQQVRLALLNLTSDLTHPEPDIRQQFISEIEQAIETARLLDIPIVRVIAGFKHPETTHRDGLTWATEALKKLSQMADRRGVRLAIENHYRDRTRHLNNFTNDEDCFMELMEHLNDTPLGICFNASAPLIVGEDPILLLEKIAPRVCHLHVSDRLPGAFRQAPLGEGSVDIHGILQYLAQARFRGIIGYEDENPHGDAGLQADLRALRGHIARVWQ